MNNDSQKLVTVATCGEMFEAEVIAAKLKANGIEAFVHDKTPISYITSPYAITNDIDVEVLQADAFVAAEIIKCG